MSHPVTHSPPTPIHLQAPIYRHPPTHTHPHPPTPTHPVTPDCGSVSLSLHPHAPACLIHLSSSPHHHHLLYPSPPLLRPRRFSLASPPLFPGWFHEASVSKDTSFPFSKWMSKESPFVGRRTRPAGRAMTNSSYRDVQLSRDERTVQWTIPNQQELSSSAE